ncbi:MAG: hypothetical protein Kow0062_15260 [Acidobacteriota bacterium]
MALLGAALAVALAGCGSGGLPGATPDEKAVAASKLGQRGNDEAIPVLVEAVRTEPELVQQAAIAALGRIGTVAAVDALAQFSDHELRSIRVAVAQALSDVDTDAYYRAAEVLAEMGPKALPRGPGQDPDLEVRRAIVTAMAVTKQPPCAPFIVDRIRHEYDEQIRNAAIQTLGRLAEAFDLSELVGREEAVAVLTEVYRTDNEKNRAWAVEALGKIGGEAALDVIMQAFDDYDHVTRGKAAVALMRIKGREAIPVLRERLERETADMPAVVMAHCLALLGETEDSVPFLEDRVLHASNNFARAEAARALREVGRRESMAVLDRAFENDRDGLVKREAGLSIRALREKFPQEE